MPLQKVNLKSMQDCYKGIHINRVNEHAGGTKRPEVIVKYTINYKGATIYFRTQDDVKKFIDAINN